MPEAKKMSRVSREYYEIKKASIIDAALEVCKRKTVSSVTMQDIIDEAGISQGGIYRYYKNIDEVLTDLLSRIRMEQYESIDRLNAVFDQKKAEIQALRELPAGEDTVSKRRELLAGLVKEILGVWGEETQKYLYPHKKLQMEYGILADNFPDRARRIFPNAAEERAMDERILAELGREIQDGIISLRISLEEFMEYNATVYLGIIKRAIAVNCYQRNAYFNEKNEYDVRKRYEAFAKACGYFLGLEEYFL